MTWTALILWTMLFLVLEAFFSGSELALVSADKLKLRHRAERGSKGAKMALFLAQRPELLFSATLLGQNLFIVGNSILITFFIFDRYGPDYELFGLLLSPLVLIFGEAVPKSLFQQWADRMAPKISPVIIVFSYLFFPLVWPLSKLTLLLMGGVKGSLTTGNEVTRESLELLLRESDVPHDLSPVFKKSLLKILSFPKKEAHEIMTPLIEVFSLRETTSIGEALALCHEEGYSNVPVFQKRAYNIVGVVTFLDLLLAQDLTKPIQSLMEEPLYVPPHMGLKNLFMLFRDKAKSIAVVVDEYGATSGMITLEDLVEEVVGEIQDEFDDENLQWKRVSKSQYMIRGRASLDELNEKIRLGLPKGHSETMAGFLMEHFGKMPQTGEILHFGRLTFLIKKATPRSIEEVMVEM